MSAEHDVEVKVDVEPHNGPFDDGQEAVPVHAVPVQHLRAGRLGIDVVDGAGGLNAVWARRHSATVPTPETLRQCPRDDRHTSVTESQPASRGSDPDLGMATISGDILARYAGDAARGVDGVGRLVRRRPARISEEDGLVTVELHIGVEWGAPIPAVGLAVQERVRDYLTRMADLERVIVNVVVDEIE